MLRKGSGKMIEILMLFVFFITASTLTLEGLRIFNRKYKLNMIAELFDGRNRYGSKWT